MLNNPLHDNPEREQRVRERAYHLWEADGKPHGRDVEYWQRARELIAMEENGESARLPNPQIHAKSARESGIEEAEIQDDLGEFPDRFADQGEVQPSPTPADSPRRRSAAAAASPKAPTAATRKPAARGKKPKTP
ncbi:MAG TPA: DUF2934 domain-containing protein [Acetobacteraceae bacterium]|jgi:hypothetical protein|nr:DUF2934 domain-containing protein [Acetobacteraceae bacterium]